MSSPMNATSSSRSRTCRGWTHRQRSFQRPLMNLLDPQFPGAHVHDLGLSPVMMPIVMPARWAILMPCPSRTWNALNSLPWLSRMILPSDQDAVHIEQQHLYFFCFCFRDCVVFFMDVVFFRLTSVECPLMFDRLHHSRLQQVVEVDHPFRAADRHQGSEAGDRTVLHDRHGLRGKGVLRDHLGVPGS